MNKYDPLCYQKVGQLLASNVSFYTCFMKLFVSKSCGNGCVRCSECSRGCTSPAQAGRHFSRQEAQQQEHGSPHVSPCSAAPLSQEKALHCAGKQEFPPSREPHCWQQRLQAEPHSEKPSQPGLLEGLGTELLWGAAAQPKRVPALLSLGTGQVPSVRRE